MLNHLQKYSRLYLSSSYAGAAHILNSSFNLLTEQVVPLSISHGVDFEHLTGVMDINSPEPLHWAYNDSIARRAAGVKPSVRLPHPWWFITKDRIIEKGEGTLVIGPPPGPVNDSRLSNLLSRDYKIDELDMLIKARGCIDDSVRFWTNYGIRVVSAEPQDNQFYERLVQILGRYEKILCPTFSSAGIFAAALGKKVEYLRGFKYLAYESYNFMNYINFDSKSAKRFVKTFVYQEKKTVTNLAQQTLGFENSCIEKLKLDYLLAVSKIKSPTFRKSMFSPIYRELALYFGYTGLANMSTGEILKKLIFRQKVAIIEIDELSVWLNGVNSQNFSFTLVPYLEKKTEPGAAP